jgi:hypothetical protein
VSSIYTKHMTATKGLTIETLAKNWMITLTQAKLTLDATTQRAVRTRPEGLVRRYKTNDRLLRYKRLTCMVFTDTFKANTMSKRQNLYGQIYIAIPSGYVRVYSMKKKGDTHETLQEFLRDVGAPEKIVVDGSKEQVMGEFRKLARDAGCKVVQVEPYTPHSNQAEVAIRELKKSTRRKMVSAKSPKRLWDDCVELEAEIKSHTALAGYHHQGEVPATLLTGETSDISRIAEFGWYQWIYWFDQKAAFPDPKKTLGRYLGPTRDVGPALTAKILKKNGHYAFRSTYIAVSPDDLKQPDLIKEMAEFDKSVEEKLGPHVANEDLPEMETPEYEPYEDDNTPPVTIPERDDYDATAFDPYLHAEVLLPHQEGTLMKATVKARKRDAGGDPVGHIDVNPILDT